MQMAVLEPIDYLMIGHLTVDLTAEGPKIGGTAAYSALTARALGLRSGIVTSWGAEVPLGTLSEIPVLNIPAEESTTFENIITPAGRLQNIRALASKLDYYQIPEPWRNASIVHLGPVAQEVEPAMVRNFPSALLGITPQGWLRDWDETGLVSTGEWPEASFVLGHSGAAVISLEDMGGDEDRVNEIVASCRVLAITEGAQGTRLYWNGDVRRFRPPEVNEVDATGAGDIFAACFFIRLFTTRDPWEAARFATQLSAKSVSRPALLGIPTPEEIEECMVEVL